VAVMPWEIRLRGPDASLARLSKDLTSGGVTVRQGDDARYFLWAKKLDAITDAGAIEDAAQELVHALNGAARLEHSAFQIVELDRIVELDKSGRRKTLMLGHATAEMTVSAAGRLDGTPLPDWLAIRGADRRVAKALLLYGAQAQTWYSLYGIYELVEEDVGERIHREGWATKRRLERFTRTADSWQVLREAARHATEKFEPPRHPMSLSEARTLIRALLLRWLDYKRRLPPTPREALGKTAGETRRGAGRRRR
jgi:hypothetical protein